MSETIDQIVDRVDDHIVTMTSEGGAWQKPATDSSIPSYRLDPRNSTSDLEGVNKIIAQARYGNWVGGGYGDDSFTKSFDFEDMDVATPEGVARFRSELSKYEAGGIFYEDPRTPVRDAFDELGREHDLLYQEANLNAARAYLAAGEKFQTGDPSYTRAMFEADKQKAIADNLRGQREADLWWIKTGQDVLATDPYGVALKNIGDALFGIHTDLYYAVNPPAVSATAIAEEIGEAYGSRLGKIIAGDGWFAQRAGSTVGKVVGEELVKLLDGNSDIGASLLAVAGGGTTLGSAIESAFTDLGQHIENPSADDLKKISHLLLAEAAQALGLTGFESYAFTTAGGDIADYLIREFKDGGLLSDDISGILDHLDDLNFSDVGNYLLDLAAEYVINDFIGGLFDSARGLVDIDSKAEAYYAEAASIAGSVIGNYLLPYLGGKIGETIGYIVGSLQFEVLDYIFGGGLSGLFEADPVGAYYIDFDRSTDHLFVVQPLSDQHWDRNHASNVELNQLKAAALDMTNAYLAYVNRVIDAVGGKLDLGYFAVTHSDGALNHAAIGYHDHHFQVMRTNGGDKFHSDDPTAIITDAVKYELSHLTFYGGDLTVTRSVAMWQAAVAAAAGAASPLPLAFASLVSVKPTPDQNVLGQLNANLQIASDYRLYLDNSETINLLMQNAPDSPFTLGWIATLAGAADLGLNLPYVGSPDGGAGTADADNIFSADGDDVLYGNDGNDQIRSYGGNDTIYGGNGDDHIAGDGGDDLLLGDDGNDALEGGEGQDRLFGFVGDDVMDGGAGNDEIAGEDGNDRLTGGTGADIIYGDGMIAGNDWISGGNGEDMIHGGGGNDQIWGDADADQIWGDAGADAISGGTGDDVMHGGAGDDVMAGDAGDDRLLGDAGDDRISGGAGRDVLYGLGGNDELSGDAEDDQLLGDDGDDVLIGGAGNDLLEGWAGRDHVDGGDGDDVLHGDDGDDVLTGGAGADRLFGDRSATSPAALAAEARVITEAHAQLGIGDFAILYQGEGYDVAGLAGSDHDLLIINPARIISIDQRNGEQLWTAREIATISANGKAVIGYVDLAKINDFVGYWDQHWTSDGSADGTLTTTAPAWLSASDAAFDHTRLVNYWDIGWRNTLFARVDAMIAQGFSGLFLDDVVEYFSRRGSDAAQIAQAAREMRDLVTAVAEHARATVSAQRGSDAASKFVVIVNGAPFIVQDTTADGSAANTSANDHFYNAFDAVLAENYVSGGLTYAIDQLNREYANKGITLLSADTGQVTRQQQIQSLENAAQAGFLPFVTASSDYSSAGGRFVVGLNDQSTPGNDILEGGVGADFMSGGGGIDLFRGSLADLDGDTIGDLTIGEHIQISDTSFDSFAYERAGSGLSLPGGAGMTIQLTNARLAVARGNDGGTDLIPVQRMSGLTDFDGNGHSDLLWRHADGAFSVWQVAGNVNGNQIQTNSFIDSSVAVTWQIRETFDFNGDGRSDILWRNSDSGTWTIWAGRPNGFTQNVYVDSSVDRSWDIAATGDVNGDGRDDIIWRGTDGAMTIWQSSATGFSRNVVVELSVSTVWEIAGLADFNGDGMDDMLWRNRQTGAFTEWQSTGTSLTSNVYVNNSVNTRWEIAGIADFNGDGRDDVMWRNDEGVFTVWQAGDNGFTPNVYLNQSVAPSWQIDQVGDFNDDGMADILWRNRETGVLTTWQSNGDGFDANILVVTSVDTNWTIQAHDFG